MMSAEKKMFLMSRQTFHFTFLSQKDDSFCVDFKARGSKANYANLSYKCIEPKLIRAV